MVEIGHDFRQSNVYLTALDSELPKRGLRSAFSQEILLPLSTAIWSTKMIPEESWPRVRQAENHVGGVSGRCDVLANDKASHQPGCLFRGEGEEGRFRPGDLDVHQRHKDHVTSIVRLNRCMIMPIIERLSSHLLDL